MKSLLMIASIFAVAMGAVAQTNDPTIGPSLSTIAQRLTQIEQVLANGASNGAPVVPPGMGGIPMLGIPPEFTKKIEALGTPVGNPIPQPGPTACNASLQPADRPRSENEPTAAWSCAHLSQMVVTQFGYKSSTNSKCYFATLNGLFQLRTCPVGLPLMPTDANGNLLTILNPQDPSINWTAAGAEGYYVPGDTGSQFYAGLQGLYLGTGPSGRTQPPRADQFCGIYPTDSTCLTGTSATATAPMSPVPAACMTSTDCGGKVCYYATSTHPGSCAN